MMPKYQLKTILFHTAKKLQLFVDSVDMTTDGYLYKLKVLDTVKNTGYKGEWKSYYEDKIDETCQIMVRPTTVEILHGKEEA